MLPLGLNNAVDPHFNVRLGLRCYRQGGGGQCGNDRRDERLERVGEDLRFLAAAGFFFTAAEAQPAPEAELARDRARVTDIGKCKLDLPWNAYYEKELDVRFSRSYGPGRYDPNYEEGGIDYPVGYVRWTERRNMECIVDLLADGKLDFGPITSDILPFDDAVSVYEKINAGELKGLGILFRYPLEGRAIEEASRPKFAAVAALRVRRSAIERVRLGAIGCGNYATTMLLPHLKGRPDVELVEVATATALSAANAKTKFGFTRMSTDFRALLADADIDAVLIATRHDSHSYMVCEALRAGKAVFVDFTAAWCITCQVNKRLVLESEKVDARLRRDDVALFRADWTHRDANITAALSALGRNGVPVYAVYAAAVDRAPVLLSELLTQDRVLTAIEAAVVAPVK